MTKEQKIEAYSMRLDGQTFQTIANKFGVSKQYIQQILPRENQRLNMAIDSCIYPNISAWMRENNCGYSAIAKSVGVKTESIRQALSVRRNCRKNIIDAILGITGMTYEEAFWRE